MKFLVDNHLPTALTHWLRSKGHAALHARDIHLEKSEDIEIWEHAAKEGCVIITKDEDFANLSLLKSEPVSVVWLRFGNCRKQVLVAAIEGVWSQIEESLAQGERVIEVY